MDNGNLKMSSSSNVFIIHLFFVSLQVESLVCRGSRYDPGYWGFPTYSGSIFDAAYK